jgi:hypothetical protein
VFLSNVYLNLPILAIPPVFRSLKLSVLSELPALLVTTKFESR